MTEIRRTALLIVDVQNDFLPPTGKLAVDNGRDILPHVQHLLDENRNWPWIKVIASQDYHPPGHISFTTTHLGFEDKPFQTINVKTPQRDDIEQILWPEHCIQGTPGCEIENSLKESLKPWQVKGLYHLVRKGTDKHMDAYSAFASPTTPSVSKSIAKGTTSQASAIQESPLASYLRSVHIERLVITGIATDVCVKETAEDALSCGFEIVLVREAMKGVDSANSEKSLREFSGREGASVVDTVREVHSLLI